MRLDVDQQACTLKRGGFSWEIAKDISALAECKALVDHVYFERLGLNVPSTSAAAPVPESLMRQRAVLLLRDGDDHVVGTMTLQSWAFDWNAPPAPLELEHNYAFETLGIARGEIAEVRRMAVLPEQPRALNHLLAAAVEVSEQAGIRHWIGLVEAVGSSRFDALLVHHVLAAHDLLGPELPLQSRDTAIAHELARSHDTAFRDALKQVSLPRVRNFAAVLDARAIGVPSLHPLYGNRVVVPMLAEVARFRRKLARHLTPKEAP